MKRLIIKKFFVASVLCFVFAVLGMALGITISEGEGLAIFILCLLVVY